MSDSDIIIRKVSGRRRVVFKCRVCGKESVHYVDPKLIDSVVALLSGDQSLNGTTVIVRYVCESCVAKGVVESFRKEVTEAKVRKLIRDSRYFLRMKGIRYRRIHGIPQI